MTDANNAFQGEVSLFYYVQDDPGSTVDFAGLVGESVISGLTKSFGDLTANLVKDPSRPNHWLIQGKRRGAPELGELTIDERIKRHVAGALERSSRTLCDHAFVIPIDSCGRPDSLATWDSLFIIDRAAITELDAGALSQFDGSNDNVQFSGTYSVEDWERIFTLQLGERADSVVLAEVLDIVYADEVSCGTCSPYSTGCLGIYALTRANSGSPGLSSQLAFTTDGSAYNVGDINSLGGLSGDALAAVGIYLVVVSEASGSHHYNEKATPADGGWTEVSTGYNAAGSPRDIYAASPQEVGIVGAGGYVYRSSNITQSVTEVHSATETTQDGNAIHIKGQVWLTGHNSNVLLLSVNGGDSWVAKTGPVVGVNVTAVQIHNSTSWTVGMANGTVWYTDDTGATWTQRSLPDQANVTIVNDIVFDETFDQVGYVAVQKIGTGYLYRTVTGGREWYDATPGIVQMGTAPERYNKVAVCGANNVAAGGIKDGSTDGLIVTGVE